jgi:hypothetical protein
MSRNYHNGAFDFDFDFLHKPILSEGCQDKSIFLCFSKKFIYLDQLQTEISWLWLVTALFRHQP